MRNVRFFRGMGIALTLAMALGQLPAVAAAAVEDGICDHHPAHTEVCGYAEGTACTFAENGCEECEKEAELTTIIGTDVIIDGYKFPYTGEEIRPEITVTVGGTQLKAEEQYTLTYENNVEVGTASVTVTGVKEAGYTGIVTIEFTIEAPAEDTKPEETEPEQTEPEQTEPEQTEPEQTQPKEYTISKGSNAKWYQNSGKNLTFTLSAEGITGVSINDKALSKSDFTVSGKTLTLNKSYLNKLTVGKYALTVQFEDGEAKGTFTVSNDLDTTNPVTADHIGLWLTITAASLAALGGAAYVMRKKFS